MVSATKGERDSKIMDGMYGGQETENQTFLSKINSAALLNTSLHNLWTDFNRYYRAGKYLSANSTLDCIWIILGGESYIENNTEEKMYLVIETELSKTGTLQDSIIIKGFNNVDIKQTDKFTAQKILLLKKSLFLRRLQNSQGKGTAYDTYAQDEESE